MSAHHRHKNAHKLMLLCWVGSCPAHTPPPVMCGMTLRAGALGFRVWGLTLNLEILGLAPSVGADFAVTLLLHGPASTWTPLNGANKAQPMMGYLQMNTPWQWRQGSRVITDECKLTQHTVCDSSWQAMAWLLSAYLHCLLLQKLLPLLQPPNVRVAQHCLCFAQINRSCVAHTGQPLPLLPQAVQLLPLVSYSCLAGLDLLGSQGGVSQSKLHIRLTQARQWITQPEQQA